MSADPHPQEDTATTTTNAGVKRPRSGYTESNEDRVAKVQTFIRDLHFSKPLSLLRAHEGDRRPCPTCGKRRLYYCYDCLAVTHPESHPPPLALPLNVYVILHPNELRGKSTSLAASTISPDLHIVEYPTVPEELEADTTLVLYPSAESVGLHEVEHLETYKNVVFIDSTWQQSKCIARDARVTRFKHVRIKERTSLFWRFQNNDPTYLATVEAIYYFLREYVTQVNKCNATPTPNHGNHTNSHNNKQKQIGGSPSSSSPSVAAEAADDAEDEEKKWYHGEVDDLLYYYINQYIGVQQRYTSGAVEKYTDRHFEGYILEGASWDALVAPPSEKKGKTE